MVCANNFFQVRSFCPYMFYSLQQELNDLENEYLMEEMTMLPDIMFLGLTVLASGHAIGPSVFHVLRMSTSIRRLELATDIYSSNPQVKAKNYP